MRFNPKARLDRGQVSDSGGGGGFGGGGSRIPIPGGAKAGGGIGGLLIILLVIVLQQCVGGGGGGTSVGLDPSQIQDAQGSSDRYAHCETGADANEDHDCARVAVVNSIQDYWEDELPQAANIDYQMARTRTFSRATNTGCGQASSAVGPFYCPVDGTVYLDTTFFDEVLERQLGGPDGGFVEFYVLGHEYGHHIQNLTGEMGRVRTQRGPRSDAVKLELQADCYAGLWARAGAGTDDVGGVPLLAEGPSDQDIALAIEAAEAVGDDRIQERTQGRVSPEAWTHGSAEERQRWFRTGYQSGDFGACDTGIGR